MCAREGKRSEVFEQTGKAKGMAKDLPEKSIPSLWRKSFGCFCDESLHLLAKLYLGRQKTHSRELIIDALWNYAGREEFSRASLERL